MPAKLQIARATQPMRVDPATFAWCDHFCALGHQIEGREGQQATETVSGLRRTEQRRLERETIGCIIQDVLCDVNTPALCLKRA